MNGRRPYVRPMAGWWRRNPYFIEYMVHEATALFVGGYALLLVAGLACLAAGEAAWNAWLAWLATPPCLAFSLLSLVALVYHTITWFLIMPRTLPPIQLGGRRLSARAITTTGLAIATASNLLLLLLVGWLSR